jgi:hypothetical protein
MSFQVTSNQTTIETKPAISSGRGIYFTLIIICIVLLYIFNNLLSLYMLSVPEGSNLIKAIMNNEYVQWTIPFLDPSFVNCLWAINLALGLGLMGNFALLLYRPRWFHYLLQALLIGVSIIPVYLAYKTFPFVIDSQTIHSVTGYGLIGLMGLLGLACLFMVVKGAIIFIRTIRNFEAL